MQKNMQKNMLHVFVNQLVTRDFLQDFDAFFGKILTTF
jgi:hypothetical protein